MSLTLVMAGLCAGHPRATVEALIAGTKAGHDEKGGLVRLKSALRGLVPPLHDFNGTARGTSE